MDDEADYGLIMPFWIDTDAYTPRDKEMFVCGVEFQMVYEAAKSGKGWSQAIHAENESRIRLMCGRLGLPCEMKRYDETWTELSIPATTGGE